MKKVFDKTTMDINKYLNFANKYNEVIILWNGEKTFNGKSLVSVINALVGQEKTAIEIISNTEEDAIKFMEELRKIGVKLIEEAVKENAKIKKIEVVLLDIVQSFF